MASLSEENVRWFDVSVNDPFGVSGLQCIGNLHPHPNYLLIWERFADNGVFQRLAFEHLHNDEWAAVVLVNVVNRADVGMIQSRGGTRLSLQLLDGRAVEWQFLWQKLECDKAAEFQVFGLVNHSHASAT
jgi:hypothetical protein